MWEVQQGGSLCQRAVHVDNGARSPLIFNESKKCTHTDINRYAYVCVNFPVVAYDGVLGPKCYG